MNVRGVNLQDQVGGGDNRTSYFSVALRELLSNVPQFPWRCRRNGSFPPVHFANHATAGVPNYFTASGPYAPYSKLMVLIQKQLLTLCEVQGSSFTTAEYANEYAIKAINKAQVEFIKELSPKLDACTEFSQHADLFAKRMVWTEYV